MTIKKTIVSGLKWTSVSTISLAIVNILKISILARFLDKTDFGLMAMVTFILGFINLFMDMGLTSAILHKQNISKNEYSSLYWLNIFVSIFLFIIIWVLSPFISGLFKEQELQILIPLMAISLIFSGFGRQFKTIAQKNLQFKQISIVEIISSIFGLIIAVILALKGFGVYALVYGSLAIYCFSNLFYLTIGIKLSGIRFHLRLSETKDFLKIGIYQTGGQIVNYLNRDIDIVIIGKVFGTDVLGGYSLAKQLVRRPLHVINPIVNKVGMSIFPMYQNNKNLLERSFKKLFIGLGAFNALIYGLIAIFAQYIVLVLYGRNFLSIVPLVQLFVLVVYFRSMGNIVSILVVTLGRTDKEFYWNFFITLITPIVVYISSLYSISMVIYSLFIIQIVLLWPCWYVFYNQTIGLDFPSFLKSHIYPIILATPLVLLSIKLDSQQIAIFIIFGLLLCFSIFIYAYSLLDELKIFINNIFRKN